MKYLTPALTLTLRKLRQLFFHHSTTVKAGVDAVRLQLLRERFRAEAAIGRSLFGPVPDGAIREFFCLNAHTWIWHEGWHDEQGNLRVITTRYDVRPDGIYKYQNSTEPQRLQPEELEHFYASAVAYCERVRQLPQLTTA